MPQYHFNVHDGVDRPDRDGRELRDIHAARAEALVLAGEVIRDAGMRADIGEDWRIEVTDDTGLTLFLMSFLVVESPAVAWDKGGPARARPLDPAVG